MIFNVLLLIVRWCYNLASGGLLQPLPISHKIWDDISMDFIEGLPLYGDVDSILVVVDRLSKYDHFIGLQHPFSAQFVTSIFFIGLQHPFSAQFVTSIFVRKIVRMHGFPNSIMSDQDFMSHFWQSLFKHQGK